MRKKHKTIEKGENDEKEWRENNLNDGTENKRDGNRSRIVGRESAGQGSAPNDGTGK